MNDTPMNDTPLHFAEQIVDQARRTTIRWDGDEQQIDITMRNNTQPTFTITTSNGSFVVAQRWTQRGMLFATATDAAGETCLLTSSDGVNWEVLAPPPHYLEGGIYRYGRTVILHKEGRWFMFGVSEPMYTESGNGEETRVLLDSDKIGELLFVLLD
jgi:hypothetical protein